MTTVKRSSPISTIRSMIWIIALIIWFILFYRQLTRGTFEEEEGRVVDYEIYASERGLEAASKNGHLEDASATGAGLSIEGRHQIDDSDDRIFWFVHISDLHVSKFGSKGGLPFLTNFLTKIHPNLHSKFTVVTGDLTDAKDERKLTSRQYLEEWKSYASLLSNLSLADPERWLDIRGNHDCFDVPSIRSQVNYYRNYSVQKRNEYLKSFVFPFGKYSVVAVDSCPTFGSARPFNFFGYLDHYDLTELEKNLAKAKDSNHTFLLNHYPIPTMMFRESKGKKTFAEISAHFSVYLCGHLHRLFLGLGHDMYAVHPTGFMELEIGDIKQSGYFRIIAVDHDIISFGDFSLLKDRDPYIVITNPKDARFLIPMHEPIGLIKQSSHIRALVFGGSNSRVISAKAIISTLDSNGRGGPLETLEEITGRQSKSNPSLWTFAWNPKSYFLKSNFYISIQACSEDGHCNTRGHAFNIHGIRLPIQSAGHQILLTQFGSLLKNIFWILYVIAMVGMLSIPKLWVLHLRRRGIYHKWRETYAQWLVKLHRARVKDNSFHPQRIVLYFEWFVFASWFRATELVHHRDVFYPLFIYGLYIVVGPWFIGHLAPSQPETLVQFYIYGIYVDGMMIPILDTWMFAVFEMAYGYVPLVFYLSFYTTNMDLYQLSKVPESNVYVIPEEAHEDVDESSTDNASSSLVPNPNRVKMVPYLPVFRRWYARLFALACVFYQLLNTMLIGLFYGPAAFLISPGKTWFVLYAIYLLIKYHQKSSHRLVRPIHEKK